MSSSGNANYLTFCPSGTKVFLICLKQSAGKRSVMSQKIDQFLSAQNVPGVVALGTTATNTIYEGAFGMTNTETKSAINIDTPHAIMSMTKPITSFAIMQLVESGKIDLDAPATDYISRYQSLVVLDQVNLANKSYTTGALERNFSIRHLLTHTAGFGYTFCNDTLYGLRPAAEKDDFPLLHQPGELWSYGIATRILGEIVAKVTGKDLGKALKQMIFDPLEMRATGFDTKENQAYPHHRSENGWTPAKHFPSIPLGDGGLISTVRDYGKFLRCLLQKGVPLLRETTYQLMVTNQIGALTIQTQPAANKALTHPFPKGAGVDKWGLGFQIHTTQNEGMRSPGSYSWCGLLNTYFWGDPVRQVGGIVLMQALPFYEQVCLDTLDGFERRFYELVD